MNEKRTFPSPLAGEAESPPGLASGKPEDRLRDREGGASANISEAGADTPLSNSPPQGGREQGDAWPHLSGRLEDRAHILPVRVYYEDTDFSGLVYHASYLRFLERGRTDFLRLAGVDQSTLHAEGEGLIFAVRRMTLDFLRPARMDDVLVVETHTREVRGATILIGQRILRAEEALLTAEVTVACLGGGRPRRIPDGLRAALGGNPPDDRDEA
jgi:acyl-CoA thioester hydrolase